VIGTKKEPTPVMSRRDIDRANIPTPQNLLKNQVILWLNCANGDHEAKADPAAIDQRGLGDRPINELRFNACSSASADGFRKP
jgi:hypothetical protein